MPRSKKMRQRFAYGQAADRMGVHVSSERGMTMRPGQATPLPSPGSKVAAGAEPVITGVTAQGDGNIVFHGKNLMNIHLYKDSEGNVGLWWDHGDINVGDRIIKSSKGQFDLGTVIQKSNSSITIRAFVDKPIIGQATIYAVAQDKAMGKYAAGGRGAVVTAPGLPATIQFGKQVAGGQGVPSKPGKQIVQGTRGRRRKSIGRR